MDMNKKVNLTGLDGRKFLQLETRRRGEKKEDARTFSYAKLPAVGSCEEEKRMESSLGYPICWADIHPRDGIGEICLD